MMLSDGQIYPAYYLEFSSIDRNICGLQYFAIDTNELTLSTQLHYQQLNGSEQRCCQSCLEVEATISKLSDNLSKAIMVKVCTWMGNHPSRLVVNWRLSKIGVSERCPRN